MNAKVSTITVQEPGYYRLTFRLGTLYSLTKIPAPKGIDWVWLGSPNMTVSGSCLEDIRITMETKVTCTVPGCVSCTKPLPPQYQGSTTQLPPLRDSFMQQLDEIDEILAEANEPVCVCISVLNGHDNTCAYLNRKKDR